MATKKRHGTGALDITIRLQRAVRRGARMSAIKRLERLMKRAMKRFDKAMGG